MSTLNKAEHNFNYGRDDTPLECQLCEQKSREISDLYVAIDKLTERAAAHDKAVEELLESAIECRNTCEAIEQDHESMGLTAYQSEKIKRATVAIATVQAFHKEE